MLTVIALPKAANARIAAQLDNEARLLHAHFALSTDKPQADTQRALKAQFIKVKQRLRRR